MAVAPSGDAREAVQLAEDAVARAVGSEVDGANFATSTAPGARAVARTGVVQVTAPADAEAPIRVKSSRGDDSGVSIGLPTSRSASDAEIVDGDAVYVDRIRKTSFVVDAQPEGVRVMSVLESPEATQDLSYHLTLPAGARLLPRADGSIDVGWVNEGVTVVIGTVSLPWAVDADGRSVPTHYEVSGSTVKQIVQVQEDTNFPVTADPRISYRWWGAIVSYTYSETITIGTAAGGCALAAALIPDPTVSKVVALVCGGLALFAADTAARGKCLRLNVHYFPMASYPWAGTC